MTSAPEPADDPVAEILERLTHPAPGLLLLRYRAAGLPAYLASRLERHPGPPRVRVLHYRADATEGDPGSASWIAPECASVAGSGPAPALLLVPQYPEGGSLLPSAATLFWRHLNARREALGSLDARILLCLDPVQEPYAAAHARDLLSWCAPKFALLALRVPGQAGTDGPLLAEESRRKSPEHGPSDEARFRRRSLGPLWDELLATGRTPTPTEVERLGLPLLAAELEEGHFQEAERLEQVIAAADLPRGIARAGWLRLRGNLARARGRFSSAADSYGQAMALLEELLRESPGGVHAARHLCATLDQLADLLMERGQAGDAEQAFAYYERSLEVRERLLAANPESGEAARDVSLSLERLGDSLARRGQAGDAEQALAHYERSLEVRERLLAANPESGEAARDVSVSLERLGDSLARRGQAGDAEQALAHYERSLEVRERLLAANPESGQAVRDVSLSLERLGDSLARRGQAGDAEQALAHYERSLEVSERLLAANPESGQAARDVSVSLERLGDSLSRRGQAGDAEQALAHYERSLEVRERLLAANPESGEAARDVSVSLERLGDFLARRGQAGDAEQALAHYERSLEVRERLLAANPESAEAARDVMVSLERLAAVEGGREGGESKALELQMRALGIARKLWESNPRSTLYGDSAARAFFLASRRARAAGNEVLARECLAGCYGVLEEMVSAGCRLDADLVRLHAELEPQFSG